MALKIAARFAVDQTCYQFLAVEVVEKPGPWNAAVKRREQQTKDGVPVWLVECLRTNVVDGESELTSVRIDSRTKPEVSGHVTFENLIVFPWTITDPDTGIITKTGLSLVATSVEAA